MQEWQARQVGGDATDWQPRRGACGMKGSPHVEQRHMVGKGETDLVCHGNAGGGRAKVQHTALVTHPST